ncbi:MAG: tRNA lysidine(34) synthetase TilS [Ruminococcus sp.]|nr:tRNA lysidine(34) synthetase TilS [Ruminococcus sp.]
MLNKVAITIEKYNMIKKGERILVGLSGGADSVSLLLCLRELGYSNISACHINHQLRGDESFRDEDFCIKLCRTFDIPLEVHRINVKEYCEKNSMSLEEGARKLRYDIFSQNNADKIATAHTLSDSFETMLFNLIRGTGLKGLCSIPPVRDNIIRPLIDCTREDVTEFLKARSQNYVTDSTNLEADFTRNKIRLKAIPVFKEINTSLFSTFKKTLENIKIDEDYLESQTSLLIDNAVTNDGYSADILMNAHSAIRNRTLAKILAENNVSYSFDKINDVASILTNSGKINLQSDIFAICENNILSIKSISNENIKPVSIPIDNKNKYHFLGRTAVINTIDVSHENVHKMLANGPIDCDKIKGKVFLRNRRNGDKIKLCGRDFTSSVKKLFNASVSIDLREKTAILCDDEGIIWVEGFGCAERVKVDSHTKKIMICIIS